MISNHIYAGPSFEKIAHKMVEDGEPLPVNPLMCIGFGSEDEQGKIVAYIVIQSIPFVTPAHAEDGHASYLADLFVMAENYILKSGAKRVICHSGENCHSLFSRMLEDAGALQSPDKFYDWRKP